MLRYLRYLRFGFSGLCVVACVLLVVLWVRSYWHDDQIDIPLSIDYGFSIESVRGQMSGWVYDGPNPGWNVWSQSVRDWLGHEPIENEQLGFPPHQGLHVSGGIVWVPHWFSVAVAATLAALPWLKRRFSLRTLLIATTLVAVVLGAIVYAAR